MVRDVQTVSKPKWLEQSAATEAEGNIDNHSLLFETKNLLFNLF